MIQPVPNREQISAVVDLCVQGALNFLMGESPEDRRREMHEEHDRMLEIIDAHPVPEIRPYMSPREQIIQDTNESNEHVRAALEELERAQKLAKCSACKSTLGETINIVHSKTQEILDASEKVLMMQKMKDIGDLPPDAHWDELSKVQKKQVETLVEKFRPVPTVDYFAEEAAGELRNAEIRRKTQQKRRAQKPKQKARRK